jgi:flagellar protein FlbD
MITLTRLSGSVFALNADLIERIDATPDTVVTLVDGKKYVVAESLGDLVAAVRRHRAEILALSTHLSANPQEPEPEPRLGTVTEHPTSGRSHLSSVTES